MILFGDARAAVIARLSAALATRTESYAVGVHVAGRLPNPAPTPFVYVVSDGVPGNVGHEVQQLVTVRVSVWAATDADAHDLAQLCRALLVADPVPGLAACRPLTGPFPTVDPDSGHPLAYFTVQAVVQGARVPA